MWYCAECGKKNDGKYCTRCGTRYVELDDEPLTEYPEEERPAFDGETGEPILYGAETEAAEEATAAEDALFDGEITRGAFVGRVEDASFAAADDGWSAPDTEASAFRLFRSGCREEGEDLAALSAAPIEPFTLPREEGEAAVPAAEPEPPAAEVKPAAEIPEEETAPIAADAPAADTAPRQSGAPLPEGLFEEEEATSWRAPFLREETAAAEAPAGAAFLRTETKKAETEPEAPAEAETEDLLGGEGIEKVFVHRRTVDNTEDREIKYFKRAVISIGAVGVVVLSALLFLVGSLLIGHHEEEGLPSSTGVYWYISAGDDAPVPLYADKNINSDVLIELANGTAVEYLREVNSFFIQVYDNTSEQYGFIRSGFLVEDAESVDYGESENKYDSEKSLGYFYVTKTENSLTLWENPDGGGAVKARLRNGYKVSLLEKTNDSYWYVFDYNSAERGYVKKAFLTDSKDKVTGVHTEPKDKTIIGDYFITGVKQYLPLWSEPNSSSKVRAQLYNNGKVGLIQKTTGSFWYVYDYNKNVYGWVSTSYLTTEDPEAKAKAEAEKKKQEEEAAAAANAESASYSVTGTSMYLPVVKDAAFGAEEVAQLHNGDAVTVLDGSGDTFWYIRTADGTEGFVVKKYLTK